MTTTARSRLLQGFPVLVLLVLLAGDAWRYTIGWWAYLGLGVVLAAASVVLLVRMRDRWRFGALPYPLIAFLALATASVAWSFYPGATALGIAASWATTIVALALAVAYSWAELLRALGTAVRIILGLSVLFELFVSLVMRGPILPLVASPGVDYSNLPDPIPPMLYWSRDELFTALDGGRIQGVTGNSVLLAFVALLGVIVICLQLADGTVRKRTGIPWLIVAAACLVLTRSGTVTIALAAVVVVAAAALLVRRARTPRTRLATSAGIVAVVAAGVAGAFAFQGQLFALLGKSEDLTGRLGIWEKVIGLAQERPAFGWGWVSYWVPWVEPFQSLVFRNGVRQLHAHNAWLDVWLQVGIVGLVIFAALVLGAAVRSWAFATDRPQSGPGIVGPFTATTLLPLLLLVALLVQSIAESRLIVEYGWALLVIIAVKSKRAPDPVSPAPLP